MRDARQSIARICANGYGIARAAGRVHWRVLYAGPQSVFVDDAGRVYAVPANTPLEARMIADQRSCWIGTYHALLTRKRGVPLSRERIAADLLARAKELQGVAA